MEDGTVEPRIVQGVGAASSSRRPGLAKALDMAQHLAVQKFLDDGGSVFDTDAIIEIKQMAREYVKANWEKAE